LQSIFSEAGWPIFLLLALSIAGLAIIIERSLSLQTKRICPPDLSAQVLQMVRKGQDIPSNLDKLQASSPLGQILAQLVRKNICLMPNSDSVSKTLVAMLHITCNVTCLRWRP